MQINPSALTSLREITGWSQAELARRSGVGQGAISEYEAGKNTRVRPGTARKLADALGVPPQAIAHLSGFEAA